MSNALKPLSLALTLAGAALFQAPAQADIAQIVTQDGQTMSFEYDANNLRINLPEGQQGYLLKRGNMVYAVIQQGGQTMVVDMASAIKMFGNMAAGTTPAAIDAEVVSLEPSGKKETLGNIEGEVYQLTYKEQDGVERSAEMVLSKDPMAIAFRDSMFALSDAMAASIQQTQYKDAVEAGQQMQAKLQALNMGVLRFGQEMKVQSITDTDVAAERFVLPAQPVDLGALLGGALGGAGGLGDILNGSQLQEQATDSAQGSSASELLGEALKNIQSNSQN